MLDLANCFRTLETAENRIYCLIIAWIKAVNNGLPEHLTFSLAALIAFYNGTEIRDGALIGHRDGKEYLIKDDKAVLEFFAENSALSPEELADKVLGNVDFWGTDLREYNGAAEKVSAYITDIRKIGMRKTLEKYFG